MNSTALLLMVATAIGFASLDYFRKRLADQFSVTPLLFLLTIGVLPVYLVWLVIDGNLGLQLAYWPPALLSLALNVAANFAFLRAMQLSGLSVTIPLLSLTPVFSTLFSIPLLGEIPTARQGLGVVVVVLGALWLQFDAGAGPGADGLSETRVRGWLRAMTREKGGLLVMGVALAWSLTTPFDKLALESSSVAFHAFVLNLGIGVAAGMLMLLRGESSELGRVIRCKGLVLAAVLCSAAALGFQLLAVEQVFVGVLETFKRGLGSVSAVLLGVLVLKEPATSSKGFAVVMMSIGVALLLL